VETAAMPSPFPHYCLQDLDTPIEQSCKNSKRTVMNYCILKDMTKASSKTPYQSFQDI